MPRARIGITAYGVLARSLRRPLVEGARRIPLAARLPRLLLPLRRREPRPKPRARRGAARAPRRGEERNRRPARRSPGLLPRRRRRPSSAPAAANGSPRSALDLELTAGDLGEIEEAIPAGAAAGERYQREQLATLDSERSATEGTAARPDPQRARAAGRVGLTYRAVQPPSITSVSPVISEAAGEQRNTTAPATSSGSPTRCSAAMRSSTSARVGIGERRLRSRRADERRRDGVDVDPVHAPFDRDSGSDATCPPSPCSRRTRPAGPPAPPGEESA